MAKHVRVLVMNAGSSSLKFGLYEERGGVHLVARGAVRHLGTKDASLRLLWNGGERTEPFAGSNHREAVESIVGTLRAMGLIEEGAPLVSAHRIVHGGSKYFEPTIVDDAVLREIDMHSVIAPLHNALALAVLKACQKELGTDVRTIAVFDTAFHRGLPDRASQCAIPFELAERHGIRRHGFHGFAHRWMAERYEAFRGAESSGRRLITLQLGSGCSVAAIQGGRSLDVSMGFSPLEGLMMATRSGDVDPTLVPWIALREGVSAADVERWLNESSGLLGVSGVSADMRVLLRSEREGHARAKLAVEMFCYRAQKYVGAFLAVLGGADAMVFGGGMGENLPEVRERICSGLDWCGVVLDDQANARALGVEQRISAENARIEVWVIPVDEEVLIAEDALHCLASA